MAVNDSPTLVPHIHLTQSQDLIRAKCHTSHHFGPITPKRGHFELSTIHPLSPPLLHLHILQPLQHMPHLGSNRTRQVLQLRCTTCTLAQHGVKTSTVRLPSYLLSSAIVCTKPNRYNVAGLVGLSLSFAVWMVREFDGRGRCCGTTTLIPSLVSSAELRCCYRPCR
jgi:hypothetical protein